MFGAARSCSEILGDARSRSELLGTARYGSVLLGATRPVSRPCLPLSGMTSQGNLENDAHLFHASCSARRTHFLPCIKAL